MASRLVSKSRARDERYRSRPTITVSPTTTTTTDIGKKGRERLESPLTGDIAISIRDQVSQAVPARGEMAHRIIVGISVPNEDLVEARASQAGQERRGLILTNLCCAGKVSEK